MRDLDRNSETQDEKTEESKRQSPRMSRRNLIKAGLTAAPVTLALASRPALAWHCRVPSVWGSAVAAKVGSATLRGCVTLSTTPYIDYWRNNTGSCWSGGTYFTKTGSSATTVSTLFDGYAVTGCAASGKVFSLLSGGTLDELHMRVLVAALTLRKDGSAKTCITVKQLADMSTGSFVCNGETWLSAKICQYLKENWLAVYSYETPPGSCSQLV